NLGQIFSWLALFPMMAVASGLAARMWRLDARADMRVLVEANRVLGTLHRLARSVPGGLDVRGVADVALEQAEQSLRSVAGLVLVGESGILTTAGAYGLEPHARPVADRESAEMRVLLRGNGATIVGRDNLPAQVAE